MDDDAARAVEGQVSRGAARVLAVLRQLYGELRARFPEGLRPPAEAGLALAPPRAGPPPKASPCPAHLVALERSLVPPQLRVSRRALGVDPCDLAQALLHQMVHGAHAAAGVEDAPSRYHNRRFRDLARAVGLEAGWLSRRYGWAATATTPALLEALSALGGVARLGALDVEALGLGPLAIGAGTEAASARARGHPLRPWLCRCPQRIYSRGRLAAVCPECGEAFVPAPGPARG